MAEKASSRPTPKVKVTVPIPSNLREFMAEVRELIEAGDDSATTSSDDLLQCECAYGGLEEEGKPYYSFVYFPNSGTKPRWFLRFHETEIDMIGSESITEWTLWRCSSKKCGNRFWDKNDSCGTCDR